MRDEPLLPAGVCEECTRTAFAATQFRHLVERADTMWHRSVSTLSDTPTPAIRNSAFYLLSDSDNTNDQYMIAKRAVTKLQAKSRIRRSYVPCQCPDCHKKFSNPFCFNIHLRRSEITACELCAFVTVKKAMSQHMMENHSLRRFQCSVCYELFSQDSDLLHHEASHGSPHECRTCHLHFDSERALKSHTYSHSLFHCACGRTFENRLCYRHHSRSCSDKRGPDSDQPQLYECDQCGLKYSQKPSLRAHIFCKHLKVKIFECPQCGKRSSTLPHLRAHIETHAPSSLHTLHSCPHPQCQASFKSRLGYELHLRIHSGEKPFRCEECGDRFLSASRRLDHMKRRHRGDSLLPHACEHCPARFVRPYELKKHTNNMHKAQTDQSYVHEV